MIVGLLIGKQTSTGVPGKNVRPIVGRPACEYGFMAARKSKHIQHLYVSTDSPEIAGIGRRYEAKHIQRPPELARPDSLTEDALVHALHAIEDDLGKKIDIMCLFLANNPAVDPALLDQGIETLLNNKSYDSAFSLSKYNMFNPARAKKLTPNGSFTPFLDDLSVMGEVNSLRGSSGDCYFLDFAIQIMRRECLENIDNGQPPLRWVGKNPAPLFNEYGFDIDTEWQFTVIEHWLKTHGHKEP